MVLSVNNEWVWGCRICNEGQWYLRRTLVHILHEEDQYIIQNWTLAKNLSVVSFHKILSRRLFVTSVSQYYRLRLISSCKWNKPFYDTACMLYSRTIYIRSSTWQANYIYRDCLFIPTDTNNDSIPLRIVVLGLDTDVVVNQSNRII